MKKFAAILLFCSLIFSATQSQKSRFPQGYFISPLATQLAVSGNFGEIRSNHFHSGIDFRTGGVVGEPVYAVADGYVSRIKVSGYGGGKIVYITHPNGFKSVYMHLNNFCGRTAEWVSNYQYSNRKCEFDIDIDKDAIPVKKGEQIANSGNSGSSEGPHLHFELRYAENDKTINPLLFGYFLKDDIAPVIHDIKIYPFGESTTIDGRNTACLLSKISQKPLKKNKGNPDFHDTITIGGRFYLGIYTTDASSGSVGKNGIYRIELTADDELIYSFCDSTFMFEETRAVNTMIDYPLYLKNRTPFLLSRVMKSNRTGLCKAHKSGGYIVFDDDRYHKITYTAWDFSGNKTEKTFYVFPAPDHKVTPRKKSSSDGIPLAYYTKNLHKTANFAVEMEENTLYENDYLEYHTSLPRLTSLLSDVYSIKLANSELPPHKSFKLKIRIPDNYRNLKDKMLIVSTWGNKIYAQPSYIEKGFVTADIRTFGNFAVSLDTVAPTATPVNFKDKTAVKSNSLEIKISDNLSGIAEYHCYVNSYWTLADFNGKTSSITVKPENLNIGENALKLVIYDKLRNVAEYEWTIIR